MCATAFAHILPNDIEITFVKTPDVNNADVFYGTITSPDSYKFLLNIGVSEPELLLKSNTAFSLGTHYKRWGERSWIQSFHHALPIFNGVELHHHVMRLNDKGKNFTGIEPYIMSVQAAYKGVFAHPPSERKTPLADVEYGYHFLPSEWANIFSARSKESRVKIIDSDITTVQREGNSVTSLKLKNGPEIKADLYIDCTGETSKFQGGLDRDWTCGRHLQAFTNLIAGKKNGGICRTVTGTDDGWQAETPLRNFLHKLKVISADTDHEELNDEGLKGHKKTNVQTGYQTAPWKGNCVAIGHAAAILEPLTTAPMLLLQRDITRLLELIPISQNMSVESREYNRRFTDDYVHACIFQRAFFETEHLPKTPYWNSAQSAPKHEKLSAKIDQFKSRGARVHYDHEPFNAQEWTMLHFGLGHIPERYDLLAEGAPKQRIENSLEQMRMAIAKVADKMPAHEAYMSNLLKYLKEKHG